MGKYRTLLSRTRLIDDAFHRMEERRSSARKDISSKSMKD